MLALIEIGKDQDLLGTVFTAAVPAAGVLIASILMLIYLGVRLAARLLRLELPLPRKCKETYLNDPRTMRWHQNGIECNRHHFI
jgi:hypothetical protein